MTADREVYVAVARTGGMIDEVAVFDTLAVARSRVRAWAGDMVPAWDRADDDDVCGEYVDGSGDDIWFLDIYPLPIITAVSEGAAMLAELAGAGFLPDEWKARAERIAVEMER